MIKKTTPPLFPVQARPVAVPDELLHLDAATEIQVVGGLLTKIDGGYSTTVGEHTVDLRTTIARQALGYFTIGEVARILSDATGSSVRTQLQKLRRAIHAGKLEALDLDDKMTVLEPVGASDFACVVRAVDVIAAGFQFPAAPSAPAGQRAQAESQGWALSTPKRFQGYGKPLYDFLKAALDAGQPCPTARDILDGWKLVRPNDVTEVTDNGLKYYDASGDTKAADIEAIRKTIGRMTSI